MLSKMKLFANEFYTFIINWVATEARNVHIKYMFCFICND